MMIYTVTLNPSIDYVVRMDRLVSGITNRTTEEKYDFGGKGINVSRVLSELDTASTALGFTAGFTGEAIENGLKNANIPTDFIRLQRGISRINVKIKAQGTNGETEINGQGPDITEEELALLLQKTDRFADGDTLVLAGSIPPSLPDDTYTRILARLADKNLCAVVDASNRLLVNTLPYRPFLIKPNRQELSELFGADIPDKRSAAHYAAKLQEKGARNVIVSLGGDGAILLDECGQLYYSGVLKQTVRSTVGAGDSMVAGFLAGYRRTNDYAYAFRLGSACGNATAFSQGLAKREKIEELLAQLTIERLS